MAIDSQEIVAVVNGGSRTDWGRRVEEREREREKGVKLNCLRLGRIRMIDGFVDCRVD